MALGNPLSIFKIGFGAEQEVGDYTKFGMDWLLFGFTTARQDNYKSVYPQLGEEFTVNHRKTKKVRIMIQSAGPLVTYRARHKTVRDMIYF